MKEHIVDTVKFAILIITVFAVDYYIIRNSEYSHSTYLLLITCLINDLYKNKSKTGSSG